MSGLDEQQIRHAAGCLTFSFWAFVGCTVLGAVALWVWR